MRDRGAGADGESASSLGPQTTRYRASRLLLSSRLKDVGGHIVGNASSSISATWTMSRTSMGRRTQPIALALLASLSMISIFSGQNCSTGHGAEEAPRPQHVAVLPHPRRPATRLPPLNATVRYVT